MKVYRQLLEAKKEIRKIGIQGTTLLEFGGKRGNQKSKGLARGIDDVLSPVVGILLDHELHIECNEVELKFFQTTCHSEYTDIVVKNFNNREYSQPRQEYSNIFAIGTYSFVNADGERTHPCEYFHQGNASDPMFNGGVSAQTSALRTFLLFSCGIPTMDGEDHDKYKPKQDTNDSYSHSQTNPEMEAKIIMDFTKEAFEQKRFEDVRNLWISKYLPISQRIPNKNENFQAKIQEIFDILKKREQKVG